MEYLKLVIILVISYLIGSILTGDLVARLKKVDLRNQGSGNVGATNVFRNMGSLFGAIVLLGDALKGLVVVLLVKRVWGSTFGIDLAVLAGITVIIGHNWSIFAKFKGGKGIATSLGVAIGLTPLSLSIAVTVWIVIFVISGYVSLASVIAVSLYPLAVYLFYKGDLAKLLFAFLIMILAIYRHKQNIIRLIKGEENRILYKNKRGAKQE